MVLLGTSFTMVSDSCHSGGLIDKEKEQIGPHARANKRSRNKEKLEQVFTLGVNTARLERKKLEKLKWRLIELRALYFISAFRQDRDEKTLTACMVSKHK